MMAYDEVSSLVSGGWGPEEGRKGSRSVLARQSSCGVKRPSDLEAFQH